MTGDARRGVHPGCGIAVAADPALVTVPPLPEAVLAAEREAVHAAALVAVFVLVPAAVAAAAVLVLFVLSLAVIVAPLVAAVLTWLAWHCNRRPFPADPR